MNKESSSLENVLTILFDCKRIDDQVAVDFHKKSVVIVWVCFIDMPPEKEREREREKE